MRIVAVITAALMSMLAPFALHADEVSDFYKGRQVTLIIGYGPGGGYDVYGRIVARHIGRFIPGEPTVVVQNMPGAGSLVAVNHLYNTAPKDGTVVATFAREMPMMGILGGNPNAKYDPRRFTWLGSVSSSEEDAYLMFARKDAPVQKIEDAIGENAKELVLGATAQGAAGNEWAVLLRDQLGLKVRLVAGYPDSAGIFLAVERGEVQGRSLDYSAVRSSRPQWLTPDGDMRVLLQFGRQGRHRDFPNVPTAREIAKTDFAKRLIDVADLSNTLARPFAAPPDVPPARAKALQAAFMAATKDKQFLAEADKLRIETSPISGEEVLARIGRLAASSPDLLDYLRKLRSENKE
jgi:tripartite-type tricarboxylate transporter receptor subunit TctC